ncbi:MAG: hypothetical protein BalsKO_01100 [Balneolaceae bacterium]
MREIQSLKIGSRISLKNGNWEITLTDPSLNKFNFGYQITDRYITTDILSPFGEKAILYNTVQKKSVKIALNFEDIDQTKIAKLSFKASKAFFENWRVSIMDNRTNTKSKIIGETELYVSPIIELNKLSNMGFVEGALEKGKSFFEIHLQLKAS